MVVSIAWIFPSPIDHDFFISTFSFSFSKKNFQHRTLTRVPHERVNERNFHPTQQITRSYGYTSYLSLRLNEKPKSKIIYFTFYNVLRQGSNVTCRTNLLRSQLNFGWSCPNYLHHPTRNHGKKDG